MLPREASGTFDTPIWKLSVTVEGLRGDEVYPHLGDLEDEFRFHPWLLAPRVAWREPNGPLTITLKYAAASAELASSAANDDLMHCIVSVFRFDRDISVDIECTG